MDRRTFLGLLGAAPLAALAPWRPPLATWQANMVNGLMAGVRHAPARSWLLVWDERCIVGGWPVDAGRYVRAVYEGDGQAERVIGFKSSDDGVTWSDLPEAETAFR